MGKTAKNERAKLTASYFNNIAVAAAVAGVVVPYFNFLQGDRSSSGLTHLQIGFYAAEAVTAFLVSGSCHMLARTFVSDVED
jgi:hypothetical protein